MYFYHYYERGTTPFLNLSDLPYEEARKIWLSIKRTKELFPNSISPRAKSDSDYITRRRELEKLAREMFIEMGGKPEILRPHYMVIEAVPWLGTWYEDGDFLKINVDEFNMECVSFTYGDMFPTFSPFVKDNKEYRKKLYNYEGILKLIEKYGLPQDWNADGSGGPERFIEVQVWQDEPIKKYV